MFKKTYPEDKVLDKSQVPSVSSDEAGAQPAEPEAERPTGSTARSVSYIGPDLHFTGVVSANEGLVVEGTFEGKLIQEHRSLTVGKRGRINGQIQAGEIDVRGKVEGDIYATERIRLYAGCEVTGTIYCKRISTEEGAVFNGSVDMSLEEIRPEGAKLELAGGTGAPQAKESA